MGLEDSEYAAMPRVEETLTTYHKPVWRKPALHSKSSSATSAIVGRPTGQQGKPEAWKLLPGVTQWVPDTIEEGTGFSSPPILRMRVCCPLLLANT